MIAARYIVLLKKIAALIFCLPLLLFIPGIVLGMVAGASEIHSLGMIAVTSLLVLLVPLSISLLMLWSAWRMFWGKPGGDRAVRWGCVFYVICCASSVLFELLLGPTCSEMTCPESNHTVVILTGAVYISIVCIISHVARLPRPNIQNS